MILTEANKMAKDNKKSSEVKLNKKTKEALQNAGKLIEESEAQVKAIDARLGDTLPESGAGQPAEQPAEPPYDAGKAEAPSVSEQTPAGQQLPQNPDAPKLTDEDFKKMDAAVEKVTAELAAANQPANEKPQADPALHTDPALNEIYSQLGKAKDLAAVIGEKVEDLKKTVSGDKAPSAESPVIETQPSAEINPADLPAKKDLSGSEEVKALDDIFESPVESELSDKGAETEQETFEGDDSAFEQCLEGILEPSEPQPKTIKGTVKFYHKPDRNNDPFGIIEGDDGINYYVFYTDLITFGREVNEGDRIEFFPGITMIEHKPYAETIIDIRTALEDYLAELETALDSNNSFSNPDYCKAEDLMIKADKNEKYLAAGTFEYEGLAMLALAVEANPTFEGVDILRDAIQAYFGDEASRIEDRTGEKQKEVKCMLQKAEKQLNREMQGIANAVEAHYSALNEISELLESKDMDKSLSRIYEIVKGNEQVLGKKAIEAIFEYADSLNRNKDRRAEDISIMACELLSRCRAIPGAEEYSGLFEIIADESKAYKAKIEYGKKLAEKHKKAEPTPEVPEAAPLKKTEQKKVAAATLDKVAADEHVPAPAEARTVEHAVELPQESIYHSFVRAVDAGNYTEAQMIADRMPKKDSDNYFEFDDSMRHLIEHTPMNKEGVLAKTEILKNKGYTMPAIIAAIDGFEANPQDRALHDFAEDFAEKSFPSLSARERNELNACMVDLYYFEKRLEQGNQN
jgi:hypothetical protein